jgi:hypothetical protein
MFLELLLFPTPHPPTHCIKGTSGFFMNQFPQTPENTFRPLSNFFQKFAEIFAAHGAPLCRWDRWQMEKIFNQKNFNYFVWTPLSRVNIYINFCLQVHFKVSAARYCSHYFPPVSLIPVVHLDLQISPRIFRKIRHDPNVIFRGLGEGDSWKKSEAKISWHCPFYRKK